jgi:3,4-dihydroxy 2-butanone 4-phosphate synthase / GTP cyclohydrolase II
MADLIDYQPRFTKLGPVEQLTPWGAFQLHYFEDPNSKDLDNPRIPEYHLALTLGEVRGKDNLLTRINSRCWPGETLGSAECDCAQQKDMALQMIQQEGSGLFIYLMQEGKGIGLVNKMRAEQLKHEKGMDMYDAFIELGFPPDARSYEPAAQIMRELGVVSPIRLLTNNPDKLEQIAQYGFEAEAVPILVPVTDANLPSFRYKAGKLRHNLPHLPSE